MKIANTMKKLLVVAIAGAITTSANATDFSADLKFETLAEISLTKVRDIDFGAVLALQQAAVCKMEPAGAGSEVLSAAQRGVATLTGYTGSGDLDAGCGDPNANGTVGIYEVQSFASAAITVTLAQAINSGDITNESTEVEFTPDGFVVNHSNSTTGTVVDLDAITGNGTATANAVASPQLTVNTQPGRNIVVVGGQISNNVSLTADDTYNLGFELNVVYQ